MPPKSKKRKVPSSSFAIANGTASTLSPPDRATWPGWVELESEPAFFNIMLREMGVSGAKIHEVMSLDDEMLAMLPNPVYALIFLFRYAETDAEVLETEYPKDVWYAEQVPDFACATVALLNIVMNVAGLGTGPELKEFKAMTQGMDPKTRGDAIDQFIFVKRIHNSFAREIDLLVADMHFKEKAAKAKRRQATLKGQATRAAKATGKRSSYCLEETAENAMTEAKRVSGRARRHATNMNSISLAETQLLAETHEKNKQAAAKSETSHSVSDDAIAALAMKEERLLQLQRPTADWTNRETEPNRASDRTKINDQPMAHQDVKSMLWKVAVDTTVDRELLSAITELSEIETLPDLRKADYKSAVRHASPVSGFSGSPHLPIVGVESHVQPKVPLTEFAAFKLPQPTVDASQMALSTSPLTNLMTSNPPSFNSGKNLQSKPHPHRSPTPGPQFSIPKGTASVAPRRSGRQPKPRLTVLSEADLEESEEEGFHFCAYLPIGRNIWKLDGMDKFPQNMGPLPEDGDWLSVVQPVLKARFVGDLNVNLMAVVADPMVRAKEELAGNVKALREAEARLAAVVEDWREMIEPQDGHAITGVNEAYNLSLADIEAADIVSSGLNACDEDLSKLLELRKRLLAEQRQLKAVWLDERESWLRDEKAAMHRRHDYGKFVREWMGALAEQDMLGALVGQDGEP